MARTYFEQELETRKNDNQYRTLHPLTPGDDAVTVIKDGRELVNFSSNDYLGLSRDSRLIERANRFTDLYGTGSTASRLICGTYGIHDNLEKKIADFTGREAALLFNSGFQANSTLISTLTKRNSLILADKLCHNSIIQGALLSRADFQRFSHNNTEHLHKLLQKARKRDTPPEHILVITESVFSMDGDRGNLDRIVNLAGEYGASVFVDDAHAVGIWGKEGRGLAYGLEKIDITLGTFGKAFGSFGAFVACSRKLKEYLVNFCPGFIFTTAPPPSVVGSVDAALELVPTMENARTRLKNNIKKLKQELDALGFDNGNSDSQIIPIIIGGDRETIRISNFLEENGILATAIRPPTVPEKSSRIRLTLTSQHKKRHLNQLLDLLKKWKDTNG